MNLRDQARWIGAAPTWLSQVKGSTSVQNPTAGQVILDLGALAAGYYDVFFYMGASVALTYGNLAFRWMDADNNNTLWASALYCSGAFVNRDALFGVKVEVGERFKFTSATGFTGWCTVGAVIVQRA
jgi:hypothetical protein